MTNHDEKKKDELRAELTKKIAQTEESMDTLRRDERKQLEQIDQATHELNRENDLCMDIFQELHTLGDEDVHKNRNLLESISEDVKKTFSNQQETLSQEYRLLNRKLEDEQDNFYRERGEIAW